MEYRQLGRSGLRVSVVTLGTMTFGGTGKFQYVGNSDQAEATRMVDIALDAGVNLLDTSDQYSMGTAEEMVGEAIKGKRGKCCWRPRCGIRPEPARTTTDCRATI